MSQIRFITSTDEHIADLAPGFRKDDYRASILKKLEWQGTFAKQSHADAVLRGGDLFHVKAANKTTHTTMQMVASLHRSYSCPTYSLAGNHDMSNNERESVYRQQPLGVLYKTGVIYPLEEEIFVSGSMRVRVIGLDYTTDLDVGLLQEKCRKKNDDEYLVAVVHALASMAPPERLQSFFNENILDYRDCIFPGGPDVYVFGHYHKDQGVQEHMGVHFVNVGAVSRGALTFENLERKPKVSSITFNSQGISVEEVVIPHEDAKQIFDLDLKKRLDMERKELSEFVSLLRRDTTVSYDDKRQELDQFPDDLRSLALTILESAESGSLED
jgi:DNA repair exonuclease SbcCD nuclease subunit